MKKAAIAVMGAVLALTLSGCMRMNIAFTVNEDDTIDGTMIMAISDDAAAALGMTPEDLLASMTEADDDLPDDVVVTPYAQDGYTGQEWVFAGTPLSEMSGPDQPFTISREGSEYVLSGELDLTPEAMGMTQEQLDTLGIDEALDLKISVAFPGDIIDTNGVIDGQTVTWSAAYGTVLTMDARAEAAGSAPVDKPSDEPSEEPSSEPSGEASASASAEPTSKTTSKNSSTTADKDEDKGAGWILPVGIGVGALAIIGVLVWLLLRNRKNSGQGGPGGPAAYAASQPWGGQPGPHDPQQGQQQWGQPSQAPEPWAAPQQQPQEPQQGQQWGQPQQPGQPGQQPGQQWGNPQQ